MKSESQVRHIKNELERALQTLIDACPPEERATIKPIVQMNSRVLGVLKWVLGDPGSEDIERQFKKVIGVMDSHKAN